MRVATVTDGIGRRILEKQAETDDEAARLRREADLLDVAGHPGLVELVEFEDGPEPRLRTGFLEGGPLSELGELELEEVAGVVAALASTIADLHVMGLVHGAVAPEHVVLDEDGRPVLCSLGYGGLAGERPSALPALPPSFVDPARQAEESSLRLALDLFGAGAILRQLLRRVPGHPRRAKVETLERLADEAMAENHTDRPTARSFADAVHDAIVGARLPRRGAPAAPRPAAAVRKPDEATIRERSLARWREAHAAPERTRFRLAPLVPVAVLAAVAAAVLFAVHARPDRAAPRLAGEGRATTEARAPDAPERSEAAEPSPSLPVPVTATTVPRPIGGGQSGCARVEAALSADVDGDGCAEAVRFGEGVLEAGTRRWAVGEPGDLAAVGDWSCRGTLSLALLRPATGDVFAFDGWATADHERKAPLLGRVGGGQALRAADLEGDGCHELVVERATGAPVVLRVPEAPGS